jgi:hypothetical protein
MTMRTKSGQMGEEEVGEGKRAPSHCWMSLKLLLKRTVVTEADEGGRVGLSIATEDARIR